MRVTSHLQVQAWARQHQQRLATALTELLTTQKLLENLLTWLHWAETNLSDKDKEPLPQEIEEVKNLIAEHQVKEIWGKGGLAYYQTIIFALNWKESASCRRSWRK